MSNQLGFCLGGVKSVKWERQRVSQFKIHERFGFTLVKDPSLKQRFLHMPFPKINPSPKLGTGERSWTSWMTLMNTWMPRCRSMPSDCLQVGWGYFLPEVPAYDIRNSWFAQRVHGTWYMGTLGCFCFCSLNQFISLLVDFPYKQIGVKGALSETSTSTREQRNQVLQTTWTLETRPLFTEVSDFGDQKS